VVIPLNVYLVYIQSEYIVKRVKSLKYVVNPPHKYITDCNDSDDSADTSGRGCCLLQDFYDVAHLLLQAAAGYGIYELDLATRAIRDHDIRAGRSDVFRLFICDLPG
jgi:hypothetical protein